MKAAGMPKSSRELGISMVAFYKWHQRYDGMNVKELKRLKELGDENAQLKRIYANLSLLHEAFKDAVEKKLFKQGAIGTKEESTKAFGEQPLGKFIRKILGLDINAAKLAFGEILSQQTLNSQQIRFMDTLINFFSVKGIIEAEMLFNPPFTDINTNGIIRVFDSETATKIISLIDQINHNAEVA